MYQKYVSRLVVLTALAVTPWFSLDPFHPFRLLILATGIAFFMPDIFRNIVNTSKERKLIYVLLIGLLSAISISSFLHSNFWNALYGDFGRNTGIIYYFSLAGLFLFCSLGTQDVAKLFLSAMSLTAFLNLILVFLQNSNLDPLFYNADVKSSPLFGFLGNENFVTSFCALSVISTLSFLIHKYSLWLLLQFGFFLTGTLLLIVKTNSEQGIGILTIGLFLVFFTKFLLFGFKAQKLIFLSLSFGTVIFLVFDFIHKGFITKIVFQETAMNRFNYWTTGLRAFQDNLLFGIGADNFGDVYGKYRSLQSALGPEGNQYVNSPHNSVIEFGLAGGLPALILFVSLNVFVFNYGIKNLKASIVYDPVNTALFSCWIGFFINSLLSVSELSLSIWGWSLMGLILSRQNPKIDIYKNRKLTTQSINSTKLVLQKVFLALTVFAISTGPLYQDMKFRLALESRVLDKISAAAFSWPKNEYYLNYASQIFTVNGANKGAKNLALMATRTNPHNFESWSLLFTNPVVSESQRRKALSLMRLNDPFRTELYFDK